MGYLFTSGTARGGTNLRAQILNAHPEIAVASDPFLPIFRHFRNAVVAHSGDPEAQAALDPDSHLDDYYFSPVKQRIMQYVQEGDLGLSFDLQAWPRLRPMLAQRAALASADLVPHLDRLPGKTFAEVFHNAVGLIADARGARSKRWVGFNDNWAVEFFAPLARAFPHARFIIHLRDPRAMVDASLRTEADPLRVPHVLSLARHWRKYLSFTLQYSQDPLFAGRLYVSRYEDVVTDPERCVREMTEFLGVEFDPAMLDVRNYYTATREPWSVSWEIYHDSVEVWRQMLPTPIVEVVDFVCSPDMTAMGYDTITDGEVLSGEALAFLVKDSRECLGWRTDFQQLEGDVGLELFRKALLRTDPVPDNGVVERCFLFTRVFHRLREGSGVRRGAAGPRLLPG